jgi:hypothetical protein
LSITPCFIHSTRQQSQLIQSNVSYFFYSLPFVFLFRFIFELFISWQATLGAFQDDYYFSIDKDLLYTYISICLVLRVHFAHCVSITYKEFLCAHERANNNTDFSSKWKAFLFTNKPKFTISFFIISIPLRTLCIWRWSGGSELWKMLRARSKYESAFEYSPMLSYTKPISVAKLVHPRKKIEFVSSVIKNQIRKNMLHDKSFNWIIINHWRLICKMSLWNQKTVLNQITNLYLNLS